MGSHGGSRAGGSGGGGGISAQQNNAEIQANRQAERTLSAESQISSGISVEKQMQLKQNISSLKVKDIDKMTRKQLLKYVRDVMLALVGEPFYSRTREEAERRFDLLAPAQSTAQLKKTLKNNKTRFTEQLKKR